MWVFRSRRIALHEALIQRQRLQTNEFVCEMCGNVLVSEKKSDARAMGGDSEEIGVKRRLNMQLGPLFVQLNKLSAMIEQDQKEWAARGFCWCAGSLARC